MVCAVTPRNISFSGPAIQTRKAAATLPGPGRPTPTRTAPHRTGEGGV
jgi:hypothetical protein